jgi:general secretion pathway protein K
MTRNSEDGVILINVLVILALSSTVLFAMLRLSDTGITRSQRFSEAAQGLALIDGAEATAIAALRRDLRDAPQTDHPGEDWAAIAQQDIAIAGGRFSLAITDATGKFNLMNLTQAAPGEVELFQRILTQLDLPQTTAASILAAIPRLTSLQDLAAAGLSPDDIARLETLVTILPKPTPINLNSMPDEMFTVLAGNPVQARLLLGIRARQGQLSPTDLLNAGLVPAAQVGVTSAYFTTTTTVTIGSTTQTRHSLLARFITPTGAEVAVIARGP